MQPTTYKLQLKPSVMQQRTFAVFAGQSRFVWNQILRMIQERRDAGERFAITPFRLCYLITELKQKFEWLAEAHVHTLQESAKRLAQSFQKFFKWCKTRKGPKCGYPRFKSKKGTSQSFTFKSGVKIDGNKVWLPKIGWVRFRKSQEVIGKIKTATVRRSPTGKWFVSLSCEREFNPLPEVDSIIGIDVGLRHYATLSDGTQIENPRWYRKSQRKLRTLQKSLSRKTKGSNNRQKAKLKVAVHHERITNARRDFQHKLSTKLIRENQVIGVESLGLTGLVRTKLAKSFSDAGLGEFLSMLSYKAKRYGRTIVEADQFYPSSKTCSSCQHVNKDLKFEECWTCPSCGIAHNRDINAAVNLKQLAVGHTERLNACGDGVSLGLAQATV